MDATVAAIEAELERLDMDCTDDAPAGVCVTADDTLPRGWVRVYDDCASAYGPADEILAALAAVEYDRDATAVLPGEGQTCYDPACYGGELPEDADDLHGHDRIGQRDNGFELGWAALGRFRDDAPTKRLICSATAAGV